MNGFFANSLETVSSVWITSVLLALLKSLPMLLLAYVVCKMFRRSIAPTVLVLLWMIVIVRMLLPFSVESPWDLNLPIGNWTQVSATSASDLLIASQPQDNTLLWTSTSQQAFPEPPPSESVVALPLSFVWSLLGWVALAGTAVFAIRPLRAYRRFASELARSPLVNDGPLAKILAEECQAMGRRSIPSLRRIASLHSPAVFGLLRTTICWPAEQDCEWTEEESRWIMRHELAHIHRQDAWLLNVTTLAQAFHWFHPAAAFVSAQVRASMEQAADQIAVRGLTTQQTKRYAELLLRISQQGEPTRALPALGLLPFSQARQLKQRLRFLVQPNFQGSMRVRFLQAMLVVFAIMGLMDYRVAQSQSESPDPIPTLPNANTLFATSVKNDEPKILRVYEISELIEQSKEKHASLWKDVGPIDTLLQFLFPDQRIVMEGTVVIAQLTHTEHEAIAKMLETWKQHGPRQISTEVRFMTTDVQQATGFKWKNLTKTQALPLGASVPLIAEASEGQMKDLVTKLQSDVRTNILQAPKVTGWAGQSTTISDQQQSPIISSYSESSDGKLQPVVSLIPSGIKTTLCPTLSDDGDIQLQFELEASQLLGVSTASLPIETGDVKNPNATIQVPDVWQFKTQASAKLASGRSLILAIPYVQRDGKPNQVNRQILLISITPRVLD